ncbi:MAG TPA: nucleoside hydrolase [Anaerolineae bacterium]|nr:nucleoside hydrolase [Anaerolineae bacterium]
MRRFWIDTDTASDDAVAILMALRWPDVQVEGISVVAGNVHVEMGAKNARYTVELSGKKTPVYLGAARPLVRESVWGYFFHGDDGMGNMNYPEPKLPLAKGRAVDALIQAVRASPGKLTLITIGPLTNIALALKTASDIVEKIPMCYIMGGAAATLGNVTPAAEFNIYVDPEAAKIVFHSGLPILMVGWEHCRGAANLVEEEISHVRSLKTPYADFAIDCNAHAIATNQNWLGEPCLALPDPVTMAIALDPSICTKRGKHYVDVEVTSELTRGMTVVDQLGVTKQDANIEVCWAIDAVRWKEMLYKTLQ